MLQQLYFMWWSTWMWSSVSAGLETLIKICIVIWIFVHIFEWRRKQCCLGLCCTLKTVPNIIRNWKWMKLQSLAAMLEVDAECIYFYINDVSCSYSFELKMLEGYFYRMCWKIYVFWQVLARLSVLFTIGDAVLVFHFSIFFIFFSSWGIWCVEKVNMEGFGLKCIST